jgi:hypothetical protein
MPPKSTSNKWADIQLAIAAVTMTSVLMLWNMFAGPDRAKAAEKAAAEQPAQTPTTDAAPAPVLAPTMPPLGYAILFGGAAPKPQVTVIQSKGGGGGGGGGGGVVTTTKSS